MKITVYDLTGSKIEEITLKKAIFEAKINQELMTQAVRVYLSNQRSGDAAAQTRSDVDRTTKKVYRQKGTGGARHGSRRAPIYVGGGKAHGPTYEQNWKLSISKKMKLAAIKSALSLYAKDGKLLAIKGFDAIKEPKTKDIKNLLAKLIDKKELRRIGFIFGAKMETAIKSARNLKVANVYQAKDLTTYEVLHNNYLILSLEALKEIETRLSN